MTAGMIAMGAAGLEPWSSAFGFSGGGFTGGSWDDNDGKDDGDMHPGCLVALFMFLLVALIVALFCVVAAFS